MRPCGTRSAARRYRLKDFNAADPADENPVRIGRKDHRHGAVSGGEDRIPRAIAQRGNDLRIGAPHACVDLQGAEPEIEKDGGAIVRAQRIGVAPDFGKDRPRVHRASRLGEA